MTARVHNSRSVRGSVSTGCAFALGAEKAPALRLFAFDAHGGQPPYPRSISGQKKYGGDC